MVRWARMPSWGPATSSPPVTFAPAAPAALVPVAALVWAPAAGTWLAGGASVLTGLWAQAPSAITATSNIRLSNFRILLSINSAENLYHINLLRRKRRPHRLAHIRRVGAQALRGLPVHGHPLQDAVAALDTREDDHGAIGAKLGEASSRPCERMRTVPLARSCT